MPKSERVAFGVSMFYKVLAVALPAAVIFVLLPVFTNCSPMKPSVGGLSTQLQSEQTGTETPVLPEVDETCTTDQILELENQMRVSLQAVQTDHSYYVEFRRPSIDDRVFQYSRNIDGVVNENTTMKSASTAKLVAATVIMDVVANPQNYPGGGRVGGQIFSLNSFARDFLPDANGTTAWRTRSGPLSPSNRLYSVTLRHLLSFTSGLELEQRSRVADNCIGSAATAYTFNSCVTNLVDINQDRNTGTSDPRTFFYNGAHLFVAAKMAVNAAGVESWASLFKRFKEVHGVFQGALASSPNELIFGTGAFFPFSEGLSAPNPAGAFRYRAGDYGLFLEKLQAGEIIPPAYVEQMFSNQQVQIGALSEYSPMTDMNEDWKYGLGVWNECLSPTYSESCDVGRFSSPGSFGSYPFVDLNEFEDAPFPLIGFIARGGEDIGTASAGISIYRALGNLAESNKDLAQFWAANRCAK